MWARHPGEIEAKQGEKAALWMRLRRRAQSDNGRYRIFFATDVHGSDRCFRKFLAAAKVYDANALILGGDVAGKAIVPIVGDADGPYTARFHGQDRHIKPSELPEFAEVVCFNGFYPLVVSADEADRIATDQLHRDEVFDRLIRDQVMRWGELTRERLDSSVRCVITPGNDDPLFVDAILKESNPIECPEQEVLPLGPIQLASLGDTNRTPWDTHREYDEGELRKRIDVMLSAVVEPGRLVFNFHCPPYDSGLDTAVQLDSELRPVVKAGTVMEASVGSVAVREAIERYRPVAGLHGHIHEAHGVHKLGPTVCINPGSDYASGVLKGALIDFDHRGRCIDYLLTSG